MNSIPKRVAKSAEVRSNRVRKAIHDAMNKIEEEIMAADGMYPYNGGRLSEAEVCRRAGVHPITLMGKAHRDTTKLEVQAWLTHVRAGIVTGSRSVRKAVHDRATTAKDRYREIAAKFQAMYQVEIPRREDELRRLKARIGELEAENARLQEQVAKGLVVRLPTKTRTRSSASKTGSAWTQPD